jgi:Xaa-Pro aminopeptidase
MIYYTFGINPDIDSKMKMLVVQKRAGGNWPIVDPAPIVAEMRLIKDELDWKLGFRKAIEISADAHIEAIKCIKPGMFEYEIQAVFEYVYRKNGSPRNGYGCIIGSGFNSCVLHYHDNNRKTQDGEMILMDCGTEYGYYTADITRTVPVNGKFSEEQRQIYQLVLDAQNAGIAAVKPGILKGEIDVAIENVFGNGLLNLGFIKEKKDFPLFTIHKYAHWLGLDVHDVGAYEINGESRVLEPGMVFTVEPGIYVRPDVIFRMKKAGNSDEDITKIEPKLQKYYNIGVRLEDDILVTETGYKNLSVKVPREIVELEELMKKKGIAGLK